MRTSQSKSIGTSPLRIAFRLIVTVVVYSALSQRSQAVLPAPDGGYPGGNTAEGDDALFSLTTGYDNTAAGLQALYSDTTGSNNTAIGFRTLDTNTTGSNNTAVGETALARNATGSYNTASGTLALYSNTTGVYNTANDYAALWGNTGSYNTASGSYALTYNTSGSYNTGSGVEALANNTGGTSNTADGYRALYRNTSDRNTATGALALSSNSTGPFNTADGYGTLNRNTTGQQNTAAGYGALSFNNADNNSGFGTFALYLNSNGSGNSAFGWAALGLNGSGDNNTAVGIDALLQNTTGSNNTALGNSAGRNLTTGDNNINIGNAGAAAESNTIRIGTQGTQTSTYIAGISGRTLDTGIPVVVDSNTGQLGITPSSQRFKTGIQPMEKASEAILSLKPVLFHYKNSKKSTPQFGLIAEEAAAIDPDLVTQDGEGQAYTVRYDAVNVMLLNEFLKEKKTVQQLQATVIEQKKGFQSKLTEQQKQIAALIAGLQRVSAQVEISKFSSRRIRSNKAAQQVSLNNQ